MLTSAAVVEPVARVQLVSVGADFMWLAYALAVFGALGIVVQVASLVVLIGRR